MTRRKKPNSLLRRLRRQVGLAGRALTTRIRELVRRLLRRLRPELPVVLVDGPAARRLRPLLAGASRVLAASLGTNLPSGLVIVVQRVVHEGRQVNGALQVFGEAEGNRRYLIQLAQSVNGRQVSEDEMLVALRSALVRAMTDVIGEPVRSASIELDVPRARQSAPVVAMHANGHTAPEGPAERSAIPIQRIDNNHA